jgi:predicted peptidase
MKLQRLQFASFSVFCAIGTTCCGEPTAEGFPDRMLSKKATPTLPSPQKKGKLATFPALTPADLKTRSDDLAKLRDAPTHTTSDYLHFDSPSASDHRLFYYLFTPPAKAVMAGKKVPLIVVLHHAGAESDPAKILSFHPESIGRWLEPEVRKAHPAYVVAPWCGGHHWEGGEWKTITPMLPEPTENARMVTDLIHFLVASRPVDPARIYLVGQSMGGFGVWDLLSRQPELFAAGIPVCGGGDPAQASRLVKTPIWAFHGSGDTIIPVQRTRAMVDAILAIPGNQIRYWEYDGNEHDACSERAFTEPALADWLFMQHRPSSLPNDANQP